MDTTSSAGALPAGWRANDILRAMRDDDEQRRKLRLMHEAGGASVRDPGRTSAASIEEGESDHG